MSLKRRKKKQRTEMPIVDEHILNYFEKDLFHHSWIEDGIGIQAMHDFGISYYWLESYIIIPHRDKNGNLVGIRRRSLKQEDIDGGCKYMPLILENKSYSHPLGLNLYGLYECREAIKKHKKVVLVEAEKSVLLSRTYYGDESFTVATCGFNISQAQIDLILELGVNTVYLSFDKDYDPVDFDDIDENNPEYKAFERYRKRILSLAHKLTPYFTVYVLWDNARILEGKKCSPFDEGKEKLEELMRRKELIIEE